MHKLNRKQFSDALQKGLGRAYLHAIHFGIDDVADLVLKACLNNEFCDPQSESGKPEYLFGMFQNIKYLPVFKEKILNSLQTKRNTWDLELLFDVALQIAKAGDRKAKTAIKKKAFSIARKISENNPDKMQDGWLGALEWIALTGIEGAIDLARFYGARLLKNPEEWVPEDEIFPDDKTKKEFQTRFTKDASKEPELAAYWAYLEKKGTFKTDEGPYVSSETIRNRRKQEIRQRLNLEKIISYAKNKFDEYGVRFSQFGWVATPEELTILYNFLLNETDNGVIWRFLRVFGRVPLPGLDDKVFQWAYSEDDKIRSASIHALSHSNNAKVHLLARSKIQNSKLKGSDSGILELFVNNYSPSDARLIKNALNQIRPLRNTAHSIAMDIIDLCEKNHDTGLAYALKWAYEHTPCSNCRFTIIKLLDSLGEFKGRILYECRFDGDKDIVQLARKVSSIWF